MKQPRALTITKRISYAFETLAAYLLYGFFRILPMDAASATGGALLRAIGPFMGISRVGRRNLDLAFPGKSAEEKKKILKGMWENLGRVIAEYPHLRHIAPRAELVGAEQVEAMRGNASLVFGAHLANWEVCPVKGRSLGLQMYVVYRKPNNPWVDSLLQHGRDAGAVGQIEKGAQGARGILAALKANGTIGMLIDQKQNEGIAVPFFGHDAMTAPAIAHFALRRQCPMYPLRVERLGGVNFRMTIYPPLDLQPTGDYDADALRLMTVANGMIENWIRERPEQWLWIHRRWPESRGRE